MAEVRWRGKHVIRGANVDANKSIAARDMRKTPPPRKRPCGRPSEQTGWMASTFVGSK